MRIMFVIYSLRMGGSERATATLSNYLNRIGNKVKITTLSQMEPFYRISKGIEFEQLGLHLKKKDVISRLLRKLRKIFAVRKSIGKFKPDIIVCMNYTGISTIKLAKIGYNVKMIGSERSNPKLYPEKKVNRLIRYSLSYLCDGYIFQTKGAKDCFPKIVQHKGIIIRNAINLETVENHLQVDTPKNEIYAVGRLEKVKGFDTLIRAFKIVSAKYDNYKLIIIGDGSDKESLVKIVEELNLKDKVKLPGKYASPFSRVVQGKVFVFSSIYEGFPNVLVEAMASGMPCVSTKCEFGPEEIIIKDYNGVLVDVNDDKDMASKICMLIEDKESADRFAKNAIEIGKDLDVNIIGKQHMNYFQTLLKQ